MRQFQETGHRAGVDLTSAEFRVQRWSLYVSGGDRSPCMLPLPMLNHFLDFEPEKDRMGNGDCRRQDVRLEANRATGRDAFLCSSSSF